MANGLMSRIAGIAATCLSGTLVACGSSSPPTQSSAPVSEAVGPAGGTVTGSGVSIAIPAGALRSTTTISIVKDPGRPPASYVALSPLFRFAPDGLTFATAATVSFTTSTGTRGSVYWSNGTGYEALSTTWSGTTTSAAVQHFSGGFVGLAPHGAADADAGDQSSDADSPTADSSPSQDLDASPVDASLVDSPSLGGVGAGCDFAPCQPTLVCLGGICASEEVGAYCDNNSECDPYHLGCGGPTQLECVTATHMCECTCNCEGECSECAAPVAGLGQTCYAHETPDLEAGNGDIYPACVLSLTCVDGICQ
jgi:hypothetical protein